MLKVTKQNVNNPKDQINLKSQIKEDSKIRSREDIAKFLRLKSRNTYFIDDLFQRSLNLLVKLMQLWVYLRQNHIIY